METIKSSAEISQLFSTGKRIKTPYLTLIVGEHTSDSDRAKDVQHGRCGRVAFIAGKKLGNAVWRNRAKRRMRALCLNTGGPWAGKDVIFLARGTLCRVPYGTVLDSCERAIERLGASGKGRADEAGHLNR